MKTRSAVSVVLSVTLALASAHAAPAKPAPPKGAPVGYEDKYREVLDAEKNEEYEKAVTLLEQIPADKATVYVRLKRAGLFVRLGRFIEAEAILNALVKDPAADAIRPTVQGDLDDVRARMPKLTIRLADASKADVWVTLDDKPVGPPATVPVNPGTHIVVAKRQNTEVFRQKVTLQDSQVLEIEIDTSIAPSTGAVSAPVAQAKPPPTSPPKADQPAPSRGTSAAPFFVAGGVLAAGSIVGFALAAASQSSLRENCHTQVTPSCDADAAGASRVRGWETFGWASGAIALTAIGVGIVFVASGSKASPAASAAIRPMASGLSFQWEGQF